MQTDEEVDVWADECLDEEVKELLGHYQNGSSIPLDIVSHMEYFYNTLECDFKVEDPFKNLLRYPALTYKDKGLISDSISSPEKTELTLYEKHKQIIFPNSACKVTQSQTTHSEEEKKLSSDGSAIKSGS